MVVSGPALDLRSRATAARLVGRWGMRWLGRWMQAGGVLNLPFLAHEPFGRFRPDLVVPSGIAKHHKRS